MPFPLWKDGWDERRHLLAFSGGPDSVFLLLLLKDRYKDHLPDHVALAYVNYHDSDMVQEEEWIVSFYADAFALKLYRKDVFYEKRDGNFEDWARTVRYLFFRSILQKEGYDDVLTAHQKDDHVETYLLQKERGGLTFRYGLSLESTAFGVSILRPLLSFWKEDILLSLQEGGHPFYDDKTNKDDHTKRNVLRRRLTREEKESLLCQIEQENERIRKEEEKIAMLTSPYLFRDYEGLTPEERRRFLHALLLKEEKSIERKRLEGLLREASIFLQGRRNGILPLSEKKTLCKTADFFFVYESERKEEYSLFIERPGIYKTKGLVLDLRNPDLFRVPSFPIVVRNVRKGDRIATDLPQKDVLSFLSKEKVPFYLKDIYPVFLKDGRIFFVPFYKDVQDGKVPITFLLP